MTRGYLVVTAALVFATLLRGETLQPGRNCVDIRGKAQAVYFSPGRGDSGHRPKVLFAPGDGGWRGFALTVAETVSSWGYDVYGFDTKRYLESFTGSGSLQETQVAADIHQIAEATGPGRTLLIGWSEGAGLMVLAASGEDKSKFQGLVTMGLGDSNVLGWRLVDNLTYFTRKQPNEPTFSSLVHIASVSPLPVAMIASAHDEYVQQEEANRIFQRAHQPKRFITIAARNHRFEGDQEGFFRELKNALSWIEGEKP